MNTISETHVDLSWLTIGGRADVFEIAWQIAFTVALFCASYNWNDARLYYQAAREGMGGIGLSLVAPKDWRAARLGLAKALVGFGLGIVFLIAPSPMLEGELGRIFPSLALRGAFIALGVLIAATAVNDSLFRRRLADERIIRRRKTAATPPSRATV